MDAALSTQWVILHWFHSFLGFFQQFLMKQIDAKSPTVLIQDRRQKRDKRGSGIVSYLSLETRQTPNPQDLSRPWPGEWIVMVMMAVAYFIGWQGNGGGGFGRLFAIPSIQTIIFNKNKKILELTRRIWECNCWVWMWWPVAKPRFQGQKIHTIPIARATVVLWRMRSHQIEWWQPINIYIDRCPKPQELWRAERIELGTKTFCNISWKLAKFLM